MFLPVEDPIFPRQSQRNGHGVIYPGGPSGLLETTSLRTGLDDSLGIKNEDLSRLLDN